VGNRPRLGEPYDPAAWTAAIRIDLREQFGGVRYGKNYRPTFALVESGEKCAIVKINDVGPLKPDRVIEGGGDRIVGFMPIADIARPHSTTSSARASNVGATVMPSAFALEVDQQIVLGGRPNWRSASIPEAGASSMSSPDESESHPEQMATRVHPES
jgi:hypothetical protein